MILLAPWLLLGLLVLPALWWLLRALPPAPRAQSFPPLRLLYGLQSRVREARRVPPWLLLLRIAAATVLVLALAQPVLVDRGATDANARGTLLLAIDDGWAAAPDWPARVAAADDALDRAARENRPVSLLLTATDRTGAPPAPTAPTGSAAQLNALRSSLRARSPLPWPTDRGAAARALRALHPSGSVLYLSDGLAGPDDAAFAAALRDVGPVEELRGSPLIALPDRPTVSDAALSVPLALLPALLPRALVLRGETEAGGVLARDTITVPANASTVTATLSLPSELRNQLSRLVIEPGTDAGAVRLLDEGDRRRPVGLLTQGGADTPLLGSLFYLRRALSPVAELREGTLDTLLSRPLSVLVAPDGSINGSAARDRIAAWVRHGGMLVRFAGPRLAADTAGSPTGSPAAEANPSDPDAAGPAPSTAPETPDQAAIPADALLPVPLLDGARQLGGAMSWSKPEHPAPFPADSPFAGLAVPGEVTISRQVLAQPDASLGTHVWARLADGTPLVTHAALGNGQLVLFHVTSTADWSNLPLSGLFPAMLRRLAERAVGVRAPGDHAVLEPAEILTGDGQLAPPPPSARGLDADAFGRTPASSTHPAGLYGPSDSRRALNLADAAPPPSAQAPIGTVRALSGQRNQHRLGPTLLAVALLLLLADLLATLWLRGLLRPIARGATRGATRSGPVMLLLLPLLLAGWPVLARAPAGADPGAPASQVQAQGPQDRTQSGSVAPGAALETRLAYIVTGDPATDAISRQGLDGLSRYANARTSAKLGTPDGVVPGRDDLAFYPLLYWPVTPQTVQAVPGAAWQAALNGFMSRGGILLIDTQGLPDSTGGADADQSGGYVPTVPGTRRALRLATSGLDIPPLAVLPPSSVLNRTFYLLHGMPGRYAGAPVWGASAEDAGNDGVSPVLIGANDWAAAWAVDPSGSFPFATIPGGEEQRTQAYRFGVNAVIYALTGNYKSDQVHVPALLRRLGQGAGIALPNDGGNEDGGGPP